VLYMYIRVPSHIQFIARTVLCSFEGW